MPAEKLSLLSVKSVAELTVELPSPKRHVRTGHDLIGAALQSAEDCVEADLLARSSPDASLHSVTSLPNINKLPYEYPLGSSLPWVDPTGEIWTKDIESWSLLMN